ncbi:MAG: SRPBCC family protein [Pseudomonadota bacterium]
MRIFGRIILGIVSLVVLLLAAGMLLPRSVEVTRSIEIETPPEAVFPLVNSLERTAEWSPWLGIDPDIETVYSGPSEGVGSKLDWTSEHPDVGNGSQEITESTPDSRVVTALDFGDMGTAYATFELSPDGGGTAVTWSLLADMGAGPIGRWMGLMMDGWVGPDYERGLANLKALAESG